MRYLIILSLLVPTLVFAGQKGTSFLKCEEISGGQCKKTCSASDQRVRKVEIMEGELKGTIADVDCSASGKRYQCCVEKEKIKK